MNTLRAFAVPALLLSPFGRASKRGRVSLLVLSIAALSGPSAFAQGAAPIDLGAATGFAGLAASGMTNTGATSITGDVGSYPTPTIKGFGTVNLVGTNHAGDSFTQAAVTSLGVAYGDAAGRTPTDTKFIPFELGGQTLAPGVYKDSDSFTITGALNLNAFGDPNAVWIFQTGTTVITASNSEVILTGGAHASNVFWQVGSSATLGTSSSFKGTILAYTSVALDQGAILEGRALAVNGAVTFDTNTVVVPLAAVPEPLFAPVLALGLVLLFVCFRSRFTTLV